MRSTIHTRAANEDEFAIKLARMPHLRWKSSVYVCKFICTDTTILPMIIQLNEFDGRQNDDISVQH